MMKMTESNRIEFKRELTDELDIEKVAVINFIVHNDYSREVPPKFEIFSDRLEITSYGRLPENMSEDEFFNGVSIPRNKELMRIFRDVEMVESLGSGMPRIMQVYGRECFTFMEHFIRFTVPFYKDVTDSVTEGNANLQKHVGKDIEHVEKDEKHVESIGAKTLQKTLQKTPQKIMDLIMKNPDITTQEMATLIGIDRSNIARAIKKLQERGLVRRVGPDKGGHWEIIENKTKTE